MFLLMSALPLCAQTSTNALPALAPAYGEMPPTFWEQHETAMIVGGFAILAFGISVFARDASARNSRSFCRRKFWRAQALAKLLRQPEDGKLLSEVSQILRRYLIAAFELPPVEMTTAEFCAALAANEKIGDGTWPNPFPIFCASATSEIFHLARRRAAQRRQPARWNWLLALKNAGHELRAQIARRKMNGEFEFQFPWLLALLGLLPVYALLRGKTGKLSALTFSSADIARAAGAKARVGGGTVFIFSAAARGRARHRRARRAAAGELSRRDRDAGH